MTDLAYTEALQEIIETFRDASHEERLDMLLEYAMNLPDLPEELHSARDTMEQVHECQSPVFCWRSCAMVRCTTTLTYRVKPPQYEVLQVSYTKA